MSEKWCRSQNSAGCKPTGSMRPASSSTYNNFATKYQKDFQSERPQSSSINRTKVNQHQTHQRSSTNEILINYENCEGNKRPNQWNKKERKKCHSWSKNVEITNSIEKYTETDEDFLFKNGYLLDSKIGEGSFSSVLKGVRRGARRKRFVAIKVINRTNLARNMREHFLPREIDILKSISHANIIRLYRIIEQNQNETEKIYIITDLADGGDMLDYIMEHSKFKESRARKLFRDIASSISYLHSTNIAHRDLKGENILLKLSPQGRPERAYLTDFGFARRMSSISDRSSTFCGSTAYVPPEILENEPYRPMLADCWSLGVILYIMTCAFMPYDTKNVHKMIEDQKQPVEFYHMKGVISEQLEQLIRSLMDPNADTRMRSAEITNSAWAKMYRQNRHYGGNRTAAAAQTKMNKTF